MLQKLTERYIINLMKEEWDKKVQSFLSEKKSKKGSTRGKRRVEDKVDVDGDGRPEDVISRGLKVTCQTGAMKGIDYTVASVDKDSNMVVLVRPDFKNPERMAVIRLTFDELKRDYTV